MFILGDIVLLIPNEYHLLFKLGKTCCNIVNISALLHKLLTEFGASSQNSHRSLSRTPNTLRSLILVQGANLLQVFIFKIFTHLKRSKYSHVVPTVPTCAVRETASLDIMGAPQVPPLNPSESIVL